MSKICAKCDKPVYPLEELKCLDKIWHKGCFKCWDCGMPLNMKNYKGFDRKPYCSAHYPQTKATVVADTPELQRLTQTSKLQSQAKYHEEFEKKIKGSKIQVTDDPESQRLKQLSGIVSQVEYKGLREKVMDMEARRQNVGQPEVSAKPVGRPVSSGGSSEHTNEAQRPSPYSDRSISHSITFGADGKVESQPQRKIGSIADYDPMNFSSTQSSIRQTQEWEETIPISSSASPSASRKPYSSVDIGHQFTTSEKAAAGNCGLSSLATRTTAKDDARLFSQPVKDQQFLVQQQQQQQLRQQQEQQPRQQQEQQLRQQQEQQLRQQKEQQLRQEQLRQQQEQQLRQQHEQQLRQQQEQQLRLQQEQQLRLQQEQQLRQQQDQQLRQQQEQQLRQQQEQQLRLHQEQQLRQQQEQQLRLQQEQQLRQQRAHGVGAIFQAMYDYDAQDEDEVSFVENDLVVDCDPIDEGWMYGTIKRTGMRGMLPANYVERVQ